MKEIFFALARVICVIALPVQIFVWVIWAIYKGFEEWAYNMNNRKPGDWLILGWNGKEKVR